MVGYIENHFGFFPFFGLIAWSLIEDNFNI